jgi:hypothetical protein
VSYATSAFPPTPEETPEAEVLREEKRYNFFLPAPITANAKQRFEFLRKSNEKLAHIWQCCISLAWLVGHNEGQDLVETTLHPKAPEFNIAVHRNLRYTL